MNIGLTYDLRSEYRKAGFSEEAVAEFDSEETIAFLEQALAGLGHTVDRIGNLPNLVRRLAANQTWDLVFNVCEGLYGRSREAQVPALLEAHRIPCTFSDPLSLALALDKAKAKQMVRAAGLATPDYAVLNSEDNWERDPLPNHPYPRFVKPLTEGTGKGITPESIVRDMDELRSRAKTLLAKYRQPVLLETYLPGREVTVGIVGTGPEARCLGVMEVCLREGAEPGVYSYTNKEECESRVQYRLLPASPLTSQAENLALGAYRALECRDAGRVDLRADSHGEWNFLEINPLAGLHPTHSDLPMIAQAAGMTYPELIGAIVTSARSRIAKGTAEPSLPGVGGGGR